MRTLGWTALGGRAAAAAGGGAMAGGLTEAQEPALAERLHAAQRRAIRVVCLTAAMVLMSLADLQITMTYLQSVGMGEGNPVARWVIEHGSPALLVVWKCASIALAALVFIRYREKRIAEGASWLSCAVLGWLLVQWSAYADVGAVAGRAVSRSRHLVQVAMLR